MIRALFVGALFALTALSALAHDADGYNNWVSGLVNPLPSWERTQRRYLPSYQYEQGRRAICGSFCEDTPRRRRDPFERQ